MLLQAAARLQAIKDSWHENKSDLDDALHYNRKLWAVLLTSVTGDSNQLPIDIRQNVANLGVYVIKQTMAIMTDPQPHALNSLILINRELASGLLGRA